MCGDLQVPTTARRRLLPALLLQSFPDFPAYVVPIFIVAGHDEREMDAAQPGMWVNGPERGSAVLWGG